MEAVQLSQSQYEEYKRLTEERLHQSAGQYAEMCIQASKDLADLNQISCARDVLITALAGAAVGAVALMKLRAHRIWKAVLVLDIAAISAGLLWCRSKTKKLEAAKERREATLAFKEAVNLIAIARDYHTAVEKLRPFMTVKKEGGRVVERVYKPEVDLAIPILTKGTDGQSDLYSSLSNLNDGYNIWYGLSCVLVACERYESGAHAEARAYAEEAQNLVCHFSTPWRKLNAAIGASCEETGLHPHPAQDTLSLLT